MKNIYTIGRELIENHREEMFEISELCDLPILSVTVLNGSVGWSGSGGEDSFKNLIEKYKFEKLLGELNINLTILGYVYQDEFFLFSVLMRDEQTEMSPKRRAFFMEFFNTNQDGVRLRHVPVQRTVLTLEGAKNALENGTDLGEVVNHTTKAIVELCSGESPITGGVRRGLVFKSLSTEFSFKAESAEYMLSVV